MGEEIVEGKVTVNDLFLYYGLVRKGLNEKAIFEHRPEESEGMSHKYI